MKGENTMKTKNKSNKNQTSEIPTTGRIGRFAKIIEKKYDRDIVEKVMQDSDKYESFNYAKKAACAALAIKPKTVVPMHFKKKGNPQEFKKRLEAKSKIKVILLKIGETYHLK